METLDLFFSFQLFTAWARDGIESALLTIDRLILVSGHPLASQFSSRCAERGCGAQAQNFRCNTDHDPNVESDHHSVGCMGEEERGGGDFGWVC